MTCERKKPFEVVALKHWLSFTSHRRAQVTTSSTIEPVSERDPGEWHVKSARTLAAGKSKKT